MGFAAPSPSLELRLLLLLRLSCEGKLTAHVLVTRRTHGAPLASSHARLLWPNRRSSIGPMPGPTFKKQKETSAESHQMEICRLQSRVGTPTPSTASAGSNLGTSIEEDAGSLRGKKKRKKRKKSSRLKSVKGAECTEGPVQVILCPCFLS